MRGDGGTASGRWWWEGSSFECLLSGNKTLPHEKPRKAEETEGKKWDGGAAASPLAALKAGDGGCFPSRQNPELLLQLSFGWSKFFMLMGIAEVGMVGSGFVWFFHLSVENRERKVQTFKEVTEVGGLILFSKPCLLDMSAGGSLSSAARRGSGGSGRAAALRGQQLPRRGGREEAGFCFALLMASRRGQALVFKITPLVCGYAKGYSGGEYSLLVRL